KQREGVALRGEAHVIADEEAAGVGGALEVEGAGDVRLLPGGADGAARVTPGEPVVGEDAELFRRVAAQVHVRDADGAVVEHGERGDEGVGVDRRAVDAGGGGPRPAAVVGGGERDVGAAAVTEGAAGPAHVQPARAAVDGGRGDVVG